MKEEHEPMDLNWTFGIGLVKKVLWNLCLLHPKGYLKTPFLYARGDTISITLKTYEDSSDVAEDVWTGGEARIQVRLISVWAAATI